MLKEYWPQLVLCVYLGLLLANNLMVAWLTTEKLSNKFAAVFGTLLKYATINWLLYMGGFFK